jgi:hypothetical protein
MIHKPVVIEMAFFSVSQLDDAVGLNTLRFPQCNHEDFGIGTVKHVQMMGSILKMST